MTGQVQEKDIAATWCAPEMHSRNHRLPNQPTYLPTNPPTFPTTLSLTYLQVTPQPLYSIQE